MSKIKNPLTVVASGTPDAMTRFYDYDGTLLHQVKTKSLRALPDPPVHPQYTFAGWSMDLVDILACKDDVDVFAGFVVPDGKTHLYVSLTDADLNVTLTFTQSVSQGVEIDWGDNSETERIEGTGEVSLTHVYTVAGDYEIVMNVYENVLLTIPSNLFVPGSAIKAIELGKRVKCNNQFSSAYPNIDRFIFNEDTTFGDDPFINTSVKVLNLCVCSYYSESGFNNGKTTDLFFRPTALGLRGWGIAFCRSLRRISPLKSATSIGINFFRDDISLQDLVVGSINKPVISIQSSAFIGCTQTFSITIYALGSYADTAITNIRNGAINATIIVKAASDTVYEGVAYAAGETMVTSNPTV